MIVRSDVRDYSYRIAADCILSYGEDAVDVDIVDSDGNVWRSDLEQPNCSYSSAVN